MEHSTEIAASWVADPFLCATAFDEFHFRFIDTQPQAVPQDSHLYEDGLREIPPGEDWKWLKIECRVLQEAYRLAAPRQPKLTVPIDLVDQYFNAVHDLKYSEIKEVVGPFKGQVYEMQQQLRTDKLLNPSEVANEIKRASGSESGGEFAVATAAVPNTIPDAATSSVPFSTVFHVEQPKIIIESDAAMHDMHKLIVDCPDNLLKRDKTPNISAIARKIAGQSSAAGRTAKVLRSTYNRWRNENDL